MTDKYAKEKQGTQEFVVTSLPTTTKENKNKKNGGKSPVVHVGNGTPGMHFPRRLPFVQIHPTVNIANAAPFTPFPAPKIIVYFNSKCFVLVSGLRC